MRAPTAGGVGPIGKSAIFSTGRDVSGWDALLPNICVYPPRWSASATMCWRRNTRCYQQRWSFWKFVYHTYGSLQRYVYATRSIACMLERCVYKTMQVAEQQVAVAELVLLRLTASYAMCFWVIGTTLGQHFSWHVKPMPHSASLPSERRRQWRGLCRRHDGGMTAAMPPS